MRRVLNPEDRACPICRLAGLGGTGDFARDCADLSNLAAVPSIDGRVDRVTVPETTCEPRDEKVRRPPATSLAYGAES